MISNGTSYIFQDYKYIEQNIYIINKKRLFVGNYISEKNKKNKSHTLYLMNCDKSSNNKIC
jgi:hypothetical protein